MQDLLCNGGYMSSFFAFLKRMRFINRWSLMRNTETENIQEHSLEVAMVAHNLAALKNEYFGGNVDINKVAVIAMYHEVSEIFTGDMPTPIKYFNNTIKDAYKEIENAAADRLCSLLPEDFRKDMEEIIKQSGKDDLKLKRFVKAADRFSALIKCIEELRMGNEEFREAKNGIEKSISDMNMPEADVFTNEFLPAFSLSLDEMQ